MMTKKKTTFLDGARIAVIGLGYVGLPLAVALAQRHPNRVVGYDWDGGRIRELRAHKDRKGEVTTDALAAGELAFTDEAQQMKDCRLFILATPTPCSEANEPDLSLLLAACRTVAGVMSEGSVIIFESTVYPGVSEEICGPELARHSGLVMGRDFLLGYAPERANPGDTEHGIGRIDKIVSAQTPELARELAALYGELTDGKVHIAPDIRTAEMTKAIENAQRDLNIAFVNEITVLCARLGLSAHQVLRLARTKWNFLDFRPGLVGGHCIGVDPYYLLSCARAHGMEPRVITAGREVNEDMVSFMAQEIDLAWRAGAGGGDARSRHPKTLLLGISFKENTTDTRNSKILALGDALASRGHLVQAWDPVANHPEPEGGNDLTILHEDPEDAGSLWDVIVLAVAHRQWVEAGPAPFAALLCPGGLLADPKAVWWDRAGPDMRYWVP